MDDETKQVAKEKANVINERIGYPDFILNDTELSDRYKEVAAACPFQYERRSSTQYRRIHPSNDVAKHAMPFAIL